MSEFIHTSNRISNGHLSHRRNFRQDDLRRRRWLYRSRLGATAGGNCDNQSNGFLASVTTEPMSWGSAPFCARVSQAGLHGVSSSLFADTQGAVGCYTATISGARSGKSESTGN